MEKDKVKNLLPIGFYLLMCIVFINIGKNIEMDKCLYEKNMFYNPKVSILIPVYNVESYIEKCTRSVMEQTYVPLEILFINDATPDGSMDVLRRVLRDYPDKDVKIVSHSTNKGLAAARETGIKHASGEYVFHVDSDDYLNPHVIELFVEASERGRNELVFGDYTHIYPNKQIESHRTLILSQEHLVCEILRRKSPCNIWNILIKKKLYDDLEIPSINNSEDFITVPRLVLKAKGLAYLSKLTYNYTHLNPSSFQFKWMNMKNRMDRVRAIDYLEQYLKGIRASREILEAMHVARFRMCITLILHAKNLSDLKSIEKNWVEVQDSVIHKQNCTNCTKRILYWLFKHRAYCVILLINKYFYLTHRKNFQA